MTYTAMCGNGRRIAGTKRILERLLMEVLGLQVVPTIGGYVAVVHGAAIRGMCGLLSGAGTTQTTGTIGVVSA